MLWLVGVVTAMLTAFYMTRQVMMVFFGKARWDEASPSAPDGGPARARRRRRSPRVGAAVADDAALLAADHGTTHGHGGRPAARVALDDDRARSWCWPSLSIFGGLLNLPFGQLDFLHQWLEARAVHRRAPS